MMESMYWVLFLCVVCVSVFIFNVIFTKAVLQPSMKNYGSIPPKKVIVFLGSGGHTGEMLKILHTYKDTISKSDLCILCSEENSLERFKNQFPDFKNVKFFMIGKAREVGSGKVSSIKSIIHTFVTISQIILKNKDFFVFNHERTLMLLNGPGSCVLLSILFQVLKIVTFKDYKSFKIVYIESLARCNKLSMTGMILYYLKLSDEFLVQWPEMKLTYPYAKSYGILV